MNNVLALSLFHCLLERIMDRSNAENSSIMCHWVPSDWCSWCKTFKNERKWQHCPVHLLQDKKAAEKSLT